MTIAELSIVYRSLLDSWYKSPHLGSSWWRARLGGWGHGHRPVLRLGPRVLDASRLHWPRVGDLPTTTTIWCVSTAVWRCFLSRVWNQNEVVSNQTWTESRHFGNFEWLLSLIIYNNKSQLLIQIDQCYKCQLTVWRSGRW